MCFYLLTHTVSQWSDAGSTDNFGQEDRASVLASAVESLAQVFEKNLITASKTDDQALTQRILLVLGAMVTMARYVPEVAEFKQGSQARCISCLQTTFSSTHPAVRMHSSCLRLLLFPCLSPLCNN